jgi:hypothetical protein
MVRSNEENNMITSTILSPRTRFPSTLVILGFLIIFSHSAFADQTVIGRSQPYAIIANTPTTVTFTAQVGLDPNLIPSSVNLIQCDESGKLIANLGRLYDDGTHGDDVTGDNIFTNQLTFNEPTPTTLYFRVSVAYKGTLKRVLSNLFGVDAVVMPTQAEKDSLLLLSTQATNNFETWSQQYGVAQARSMLLNFFQIQPNVQKAEMSEDGYTIGITLTNGLEGLFSTGEEGYKGSPSVNTGTAFSPIVYQGSYFGPELDYAYNKLQKDVCVSPAPTERKDAEVTLDFLRTLTQYGIIFISTHGGIDWLGNVVFLSGEEAYYQTSNGVTVVTITDPETYDDWDNKRIIFNVNIKHGKWWVRPAFISFQASRSNPFPNSIVYLSMCNGFGDTVGVYNLSLSNAFTGNGAAAVIGFKNTVCADFAYKTTQRLLTQMFDNGMTVEEAINSIPNIDEEVNCCPDGLPRCMYKHLKPALLTYAGDPKASITSPLYNFDWTTQYTQQFNNQIPVNSGTWVVNYQDRGSWAGKFTVDQRGDMTNVTVSGAESWSRADTWPDVGCGLSATDTSQGTIGSPTVPASISNPTVPVYSAFDRATNTLTVSNPLGQIEYSTGVQVNRVSLLHGVTCENAHLCINCTLYSYEQITSWTNDLAGILFQYANDAMFILRYEPATKKYIAEASPPDYILPQGTIMVTDLKAEIKCRN